MRPESPLAAPTTPAALTPTVATDASATGTAAPQSARAPVYPDAPRPNASVRAVKNRLSTPEQLRGAIEARLKRFAREPKNAIPGVSFAVRTPAGDTISGAAGVRTLAFDGEPAQPMSADTLTNRASSSKMITSLMVHRMGEKLRARGVNFDVAKTPIRSLEPFKSRTDLDGLTFHDLLTMTGGLARDTNALEPALTSDEVGKDGLDPKWEILKYLARPVVKNIEPRGEPTTFRYSNQGYNELALLVGELAIHHGLITKSPEDAPLNPVNAYQAFAKRELFTPLGMENDLFFVVPESQRHRQATSYGALKNDAEGNPVRARLFGSSPASRDAQAGSWGLYATDRGLSRLVEALTGAAVGRTTYPKLSCPGLNPVISAETAGAIFSPYVVAPGEVYGRGVFAINGEVTLKDGSTYPYQAVGHSGGSYGSQTYAFTDIGTGITITLATNVPDGDRPGMFREIFAETVSALKAEGKLEEQRGPGVDRLRAFANAPDTEEPTVFPPRSDVDDQGRSRPLEAHERATAVNLPRPVNTALVRAGVMKPDGSIGQPIRLDSDVGFGGRDTLEIALKERDGAAPELSLTLSSSAVAGKELSLPLKVAERNGALTLVVRQTGPVDFGFANESIALVHDRDGELHARIGTAGTHTWIEEKNQDDRPSPLVAVPVN